MSGTLHGMNRDELARRVARKLDYPRDDVEKIVKGVIHEIIDSIGRGDEVTFAGFGKFTADMRGGRKAANPRNPSERIIVPAVRVPKFRPGRRLKAAARNAE